MPTEDGFLVRRERNEIVAQFEAFEKEMGHEVACDICAHTVWTLHEYMAQLPRESSRGPIGARSRVPLVVVSCNRCGQVKTFLASRFGVAPQLLPGMVKEEAPEETDDGL